MRTFDITAPYSGVLLPFDLELGDRVKLGDALFELDTAKVYAPATARWARCSRRPGTTRTP